MSEAVEVFAGNQGPAIEVAGRTDGSGNIVQVVEIVDENDNHLALSGDGEVFVVVNNQPTVVITQNVPTLSPFASNFADLTVSDAFAPASGCADVTLQIEGDLECTFVPEVTVDGTNWHPFSLALMTDVSAGTQPGSLVNGGIYTLDIIGLIPSFRVRADTVTGGTSSTVTFSARQVVP